MSKDAIRSILTESPYDGELRLLHLVLGILDHASVPLPSVPIELLSQLTRIPETSLPTLLERLQEDRWLTYGLTTVGAGAVVAYELRLNLRQAAEAEDQQWERDRKRRVDEENRVQHETYMQALQKENAQLRASLNGAPTVPRAVEGYVYVLKSGASYKIGKTVDVDRRIQDLKIQLPYPAVLVHTIATSTLTKAEQHFHQVFALKRLNGEWFELSEADVLQVKSVSEWHAP